MKKLIRICLFALLCALCVSCANPYRNMEIRSAGLKEVSVMGNPITATVALSVYNPSARLEFDGIQGCVKYQDKEILTFTADTLKLKGHCVTDAEVPLKATLAKGTGIFQLLRIMQAQDLNSLTVDVSASVKDCFGIRRKKELKDYRLGTLLESL